MNILLHLPVLIVIIPLITAPLCVLFDHPRVSWFLALAASLLSMLCCLGLLSQVALQGPISYQLGGWMPPWGIEYKVDSLSIFILTLLTSISMLIIIYARDSLEREVPKKSLVSVYATLLLAIAGLNGICVSGDVFNVFVFLEISSIASYILISLGKDKRALNAAFKYLIMGTIGATFILIGIGFLYMHTGTLNMHDLSERLPELYTNRTIRTGFAFLTVGICLKLALFPLHLWMPNAYAYAPSVISAFLSATATKVAVYMLLRFILSVFDIHFSLQTMPLNYILIVLGAAAIISSSLVAIFQINLKRLLAYSSVAQLGYIALSIGLASKLGITAAILHMFNHGLMKGALFLALGAMIYKTGCVDIQHYRGMFKKMPWTSSALIIGGLSLIGVPGTAGFISKWTMLSATLEAGLWPLTVLILFGSLLAVIYVWKIVEQLISKPEPGTPNSSIKMEEAPPLMLGPIWILVAANIYFGLNTELTLSLAEQAAQSLLGGSL